MARSNKNGESSWFSLNVGLVRHFYCQRKSHASKECFKQAKRSSDSLAKKLRLWSLLKFRMLLRLLKRSPFRRERPCKKICPNIAFSMVSRSLSQLSEIFDWRVWGFTYQETQRHLRILGEMEDFFRKTRRWEKVFFLRKTWRNHLDYIEVKEDFFWGETDGTP